MIPDIAADRARWRVTATYAISPALSVGVEWNPLDEDLGPLANWRVLEETERRPALVLGTSSARIGSDSGRAYYATLSKDLEGLTGLPVAPYAGVAWDGFDEEWNEIGGLHVRWGASWSSTHLWDGENLHHILDHPLPGGHHVGLVVAEQDGEHSIGVSVGVVLGGAAE